MIYRKNILFVCSRNKWRSLTAETVYKDRQDISVKSAGTENSARVKVNEKLLNWADIVFVMENKHKQILAEKYDLNNLSKTIIVLDIADDYQYMDPELIEIIKLSVSTYLGNEQL